MDKAQQDRVIARDPTTAGVFEISENFVSIFALGPIAEGTARLVARAMPRARAFPTAGLAPSTQLPGSPTATGAGLRLVLGIPPMPNERGEKAKLQRALANLGQVRLALILFRTGLVARPAAGSEEVMTVEFRIESDTSLSAQLSRPLTASSEAALRAESDVVLLMLLMVVLRLGDDRPDPTALVRVTLPPYLPAD